MATTWQIKALNGQVSQLAGESGSARPLARTSSMGPSMDIRNADVTARGRIEELEAVAAGRLKEVSESVRGWCDACMNSDG